MSQEPQQQAEPQAQPPEQTQTNGVQSHAPQDANGQHAGHQPQGADQPHSTEPKFSQEELNRILKRETDKLERRYEQKLQEFEQKLTAQVPQAQPQGDKEQQPSNSQAPQFPEEMTRKVQEIEATLAEERSRRQFAEAVSGKPFSSGQREALYKLYRMESPADLESWVDDTAKQLGISAAQPQQALPPQQPQQQGSQPAQQQPPAQPPPAGAAPNPEPNASLERGTKDPTKLTAEDMERLGGPQAVKEYWKKYYSGQRK